MLKKFHINFVQNIILFLYLYFVNFPIISLRLFFLIYPIPDYFLSLYFFKSTGYTSNQKTSVQSVFKDKINYYPQNGNSVISCNGQSSITQPKIILFLLQISQIEILQVGESLNSFNTFKNEKEEKLLRKPFIFRHNSNIFP